MLLRKFSWLYRCANWRCRDFFAAENIKDIKSFRAKKIGFNISGNYSGRSWMRVNVARVALGLYQIWKTKTGKTPCAWCKMALTSHWYCDWLRIPRASSGIFSQSQHHPIGFCIKRKAINRKKQLFCWKHHGILCKKIGKQHSVCSGKSDTILKRICCISCRKCFFCLSPWRGC